MTGLRPRRGPFEGLPALRARRLTIGGLRFYQIDGTLYPSVTSILQVVAKPGLVAWARRTALEAVQALLAEGLPLEEALALAAQEPERVRDSAGRRGTNVHEAIALALAGEPYPAEASPWVEGALTFLGERGLVPLGHEVVLVERAHGFAGTCDLAAAAEDGGLVLVDWKTGGIWPEHALQLGAYSLALAEMTGREVAAAYLVGLKEGGYEARAVSLPLAQEGFLAALSLWRALGGELLR
jgi:genome maintenance exonuclease 1